MYILRIVFQPKPEPDPLGVSWPYFPPLNLVPFNLIPLSDSFHSVNLLLLTHTRSLLTTTVFLTLSHIFIYLILSSFQSTKDLICRSLCCCKYHFYTLLLLVVFQSQNLLLRRFEETLKKCNSVAILQSV